MTAARTQLRRVSAEPAPTDAACFERIVEGDLAALGALYDRYHGDVADTLARAGVHRADLEDAVHETFLIVMGRAANYDGRSSARPWILGIAWRVASARRRSVRRWLHALVGLGQQPTTPIDDPESLVARGEGRAAFARALDTLPDKMRAVVLMVEIEGLSGEEAATALGIPTATVWTRLHHARKRLAEELARATGRP